MVVSTHLPFRMAHMLAGAEMRGDDAAIGNFGRDFFEAANHVFVREPVKSPASHASLVTVRRGSANCSGDAGATPMKRGVEARDCGRYRADLRDRTIPAIL